MAMLIRLFETEDFGFESGLKSMSEPERTACMQDLRSLIDTLSDTEMRELLLLALKDSAK